MNVEESWNCAEVWLVFIGSLKVKTTGAEGETPVAESSGTVEIMNGWACGCPGNPTIKARVKAQKNRSRFSIEKRFMIEAGT